MSEDPTSSEDRSPAPIVARSLFLSGMADLWDRAKDRARSHGDVAGLLYMIASALAFSSMAAVAKYFLPTTPTQAVVLSRGVAMTIVFVLWAKRSGVPLVGKSPSKLFLRGFLGYLAVSCYFYSVQKLPIGDAVLLQYSHPVFVAAIAPLLMDEKTGKGHWLLVLAAFLGVGLIVGPSGDLRADAIVGVLGSFISGLAYMTVRHLSKTENPLTILVWFPAVTIPGSLIATLSIGSAALPKSMFDVTGHVLVSVIALFGQWTLTQGLSRAGVARGTAVTMTGPVFGLFFGWSMFGQIPTMTSICGTILVVVALTVLAIGKPRT